MKKRSTKTKYHSKYLSLLFRNEQDLNRYNSDKNQMFTILERVVKKEGQKIDYNFLNAFLQYVPEVNFSQKVENDVEEEEEEVSALESELEKVITAEKDDGESISLRYSPLDEQLGQISYHGEGAEDQLYDGIVSKFLYEEGYETSSSANDNADESDTSLNEEVKETLEDSKYEFIVSSVDVDFEQQEKIANWIRENPALFTFLEYFHNWNREVDYRSAA